MTQVNLGTTGAPGNLYAPLEQFIRKEVVKQYNRPSVTADLLRKEPGIGKNLAWDISVGTATGQVFTEGQVVTTFNNDTELLATLSWTEYGDAFQITGRAEDAAQYSDTDLGRAWFFKMNQARERSAKTYNDDLWAGTGAGNTHVGLTSAGGGLDATGIYAGQNRATFSQWGGIKLANGGIPRGISLSLIEYGLELVFNASGKQPTFGLTTANIWRLLCELVDDQKRVNIPVVVRGETLTMQLGYMAVEVNGIPVFKDISIPTGQLVFLHEPSVAIEYLPVAPARIARGKVMATVPFTGTPNEQKMIGAPPEGGPLVGIVIALPASGNFENWQLVATSEVKVIRPNANLWLSDIAFRAEV